MTDKSSSSVPSTTPTIPPQNAEAEQEVVAVVSPSTLGPPLPHPIPAKTERSQHTLLLLQMAAGAGAGAVAKTATAPLERIKILFQVQVSKEGHS